MAHYGLLLALVGFPLWFHRFHPSMALRWLLTASTAVTAALGSDAVTELPGAGKLRTVQKAT